MRLPSFSFQYNGFKFAHNSVSLDLYSKSVADLNFAPREGGY